MNDAIKSDVQSIISAVRAPAIMSQDGNPFLLIPEGFKNHVDLEKMLPDPLRKRGTVILHDADSYIAYVKDQGSMSKTRTYCETDYLKGMVKFTGILNDYDEAPHWQDFRAIYEPQKSVEWNRWVASDKKPMTQIDLALFLEDNLKDIAGDNPTGTEMLAMAQQLEIRQDFKVKSAVRLQSGGVNLEFIQNDDAGTIERMKVFDRFSIGIAPFFNGQAYKIDARLRYRVGQGEVKFWYELNRTDLTLQNATIDLITKVRETSGFPVLMGMVSK